MATQIRATDAWRRPYRFSVKQLVRMIDAGIVADSKNLELIRGRLYLSTKYEPRNFSVEQVADLLREMFPREAFNVREEKGMSQGQRSAVEPDVAVVRGRLEDFRPLPPSTSEAVLLVEVCHGTKRADYHDKLELYAEGGVPVYWIVDIDARTITVHVEPTTEGEFGRVETFAEGASAPVVLDQVEIGRIAVNDVLPPKSE